MKVAVAGFVVFLCLSLDARAPSAESAVIPRADPAQPAAEAAPAEPARFAAEGAPEDHAWSAAEAAPAESALSVSLVAPADHARFAAEAAPEDLAQPAATELACIPSGVGVSELPGDTICVIGTGDIMLGTDYPVAGYLPPDGDCSLLLRPVLDVLRSGDVLFGNLEGVFCSGGGTPKHCRDTTTCYVFRMPDRFVSCLVEAGYDVMSVANNHVNDFGPRGRISTAEVLTAAGIAFAGFTTHPWTVFEKGGVTYGFAAFSPHTGTMDLNDYGGAARITRMLDSIVDIVIISFHGGGEGNEHQHVVRGDEEYLGYNRGNTYLFAHTVVDAGADVVFGHGPHVTRAMELYRGRLICYSLGNFCTYRRFNLSGPNGIAPIVKVRMDRRGNFLSGEVVPVYQPGEGGPWIDPEGRVIRALQALTAADFPDQLLAISPDGTMLPPAEIPRVEVLAGASPADDRQECAGWAPERLEMLWTHFLGETVPPGDRSWYRVEWTGRPMLVKQGKDTCIIQAFDHHMKKLDAFSGELIREYSTGDTLTGTETVPLITGKEQPGQPIAPVPDTAYRGDGRLAAFTDEDGILHVVRFARIPGGKEGAGPARAGSVKAEAAGPVKAEAIVHAEAAGSVESTGSFKKAGSDREEVCRWKVGRSVCRPLFTPERLVVCSDNGIYLFGYDRNMNFELLDRLPVPVESAPVLYGGKLFVASLNGYIYCLGEKD
jgi:hypothetical protein